MKYLMYMLTMVIVCSVSYSYAATNVEFLKNENGDIYEYRISGYTGYSAKGTDIVAAAVSILVQNTAASLIGIAKEKINVERKDGYFKVTLPNIKNRNRDSQVLLSSLVMGMQTLEKQYGNYVIVKVVQK